ncbi:MAG: 6-pyruvoyl trahydropterin synthase family protein [Planctomycetota bacterium]|jgi:6-pyruvoyltetrahydropterin/6-carboxytetrahydropterin synthase
MYKVTKEIRFCYGHRLLDYSGPCRHLHGHNGLAEVTIVSDTLDGLGMVIDFDEIKQAIKKWIDDTLDHRMLLSTDDPTLPLLRDAGEPVVPFDGNPTAESIARKIFEHAKESGFPVERVRLWETATSWAEYGE